MSKKTVKVEIEARAGIRLFAEKVAEAHNLLEIKEITDELLALVYRYAAKNNNRHNKGLKVFQEFSRRSTKFTRKQKVSDQVKSRRKTKAYQNHLEEFLVLRKRGYSYREIAEYSLKELNIKISSETIRNQLKGLENV